MKFRAKSEHELAHLSDDNLVAYLVAARDAAQVGAVRVAAGILVWRRYDVLVGMVRTKVDDDQDVEDIVQQILEGTMKAAFKGQYAGEFFSLMKTIQERRVADFYAKRARTPKTVGTYDDGSSPLDGLADDEDPIEGSIAEATLEKALQECSERDRLVVRLKIEGQASLDVVELLGQSGIERGTGMTAANVDQIFSRFRKGIKVAFFPEDPVKTEQAT